MRRAERQVKEIFEIEAIIHRSTVCRLAMSDGNQPYIVPVCFGYRDHVIYVHGATQGKKIDILKNNNNVCFEFDTQTLIKKSDRPCEWGMKYLSVIGFGTAHFITSPAKKQKALEIIMKQYSRQSDFNFPDKAVASTAVIKIKIQSMTGKKSGW